MKADPNKDRFLWGIIVAHFLPGNPNHHQQKQIGQWCHASGDQKSKCGHALYRTKESADELAARWSNTMWSYASKKYPLKRPQ